MLQKLDVGYGVGQPSAQSAVNVKMPVPVFQGYARGVIGVGIVLFGPEPDYIFPFGSI